MTIRLWMINCVQSSHMEVEHLSAGHAALMAGNINCVVLSLLCLYQFAHVAVGLLGAFTSTFSVAYG